MSKLNFQSDAVGSKSYYSSVAKAVPNPRIEKRTKVLMVGMHLTMTRGGITTLASGILSSTLNNDFDFTFIASQAEDLGKIRKLLLAGSAALSFTATRLRNKPDLAYIHVGSNASLYREGAFIVLARLIGLRVLMHFHAGDVNTYLPKQPRLGRKFISWALSHTDRAIAVSAKSAGDLRQIVPDIPVTVIPNSVDMSCLSDSRSADRLAKNKETIRLLFIGAAGKLKGENDLIAALALLRERGLNVRASLLGHGAERLTDECARNGVDTMIDNLGPVPMNERAAFFHQADIFVLPTYAEAMPISILEAMAAGLPVIATPVGGIPEIIDDEKEGLLFPCGDVAALADAIARLATDADLRAEMGKRGRARVQQQMNFENYVQRLGGELKTLAGCRI